MRRHSCGTGEIVSRGRLIRAVVKPLLGARYGDFTKFCVEYLQVGPSIRVAAVLAAERRLCAKAQLLAIWPAAQLVPRIVAPRCNLRHRCSFARSQTLPGNRSTQVTRSCAACRAFHRALAHRSLVKFNRSNHARTLNPRSTSFDLFSPSAGSSRMALQHAVKRLDATVST